jgi:hypothetical protein
MATIKAGLYVHIRSGLKYNVLGTARSVKNPHELLVVYSSTQESRLREETTVVLEMGTMWVRPLTDFIEIIDMDKGIRRFERVVENE